MTTPRLTTLLLAAATVLTVPIGRADAADVKARFSLEYALNFTYHHAYAFPPATVTEDLKFHTDGTVPVVTWVSQGQDVLLYLAKSTPVRDEVPATFASDLKNPDGTSLHCSGETAQVAGTAAVGSLKTGQTFFAPYLAAHVSHSCTDSDGKAFPGGFDMGAVPAERTGPGGLPAVATDITPSLGDLRSRRWSVTVDRDIPTKACPYYNSVHTTACTLHIQGVVKAERIDIADQAQGPTPEVKRAPRLDGAKKEVRTKVHCSRSCTVDVGVGSFRIGGKKLGVDYDRSSERSVRIKGGGTRTVTTPVPASVRPAVSQGLGVARVTVHRGGGRSRRDYPLGL